MRKSLITSLVFVFIIEFVLMMNIGCKKKDDPLELELTVTVYDGVTGTPDTGTYTYKKDDQVPYNYELLAGFNNLKVTLDGEEIASNGTITITSDHDLKAFSSEGTGEFQLHVELKEGVTGTPESGFYYYNANDQVNYSYNLKDGYYNLIVVLGNNLIASSGTITISSDSSLTVSASKVHTIQGSWLLEERYEDGSAFSVTLTFTGTTYNGTVTDSDGGTGTYTVDEADISFTIEYPDVRYEYTGIISDEENMSGNSKRYISENIYKNGNWAAKKESD